VKTRNGTCITTGKRGFSSGTRVVVYIILFGPFRSKDDLSQRNVPRGLEREETAVLAGYSGTCVICIPNQEPITLRFATLFKTRLALFYDPDSFRFALSTEGVTDLGNFLN